MNNEDVMPIDTFTVINRTILHNSDRKNLTMLYQPIVGAMAINLYFTYWTYLDKNDFITQTTTYKQLISYMGISLREIKDARKYLEAVGLIKTYCKKNDINKEYIIELFSPQPAFEFFGNPLLSTALYTSLGPQDYNKTKNLYIIPNIDLKDYKNISVSFHDMFQSSQLNIVNNDKIKKRNYLLVGVNSNLDIDKLVQSLPEEIKLSEDIKKTIIRLSFIYRYNESIIFQLVKESTNSKKIVDKKMLINNFSNYYKFENNNNLPKIVKKTQPTNLRKDIKVADPRSKQIYIYENTDPITYLCLRNKTKRLSNVYLDIINHIMFDIELNPGVINVLIDYVLKISDNKLVKNFIEAIANEWKRKNIITVEQAMNLVLSELKKKNEYKTKKPTYSKIKTKEPTPNWLDEKIDIEENEEEKKELEEMLNSI